MTAPLRFLTVAVTAMFPLAVLLYAEGLAAQEATGASEAQPEFVGTDFCLGCHDEAPTNLVLRTPHGQKADSRTPFGRDGCETCHGPGGNHVEDPEAVPIGVRFGPDSNVPAAKQSAVCLQCHENGDRLNWHMSKHEAADRTCASCHQVHARKDPMLVKTSQVKVCITCHTSRRGDLFKRSGHPIREGIVSCSDCHNPHGSFGSTMLVKASVNETCYQCHAEKRGPFLWEHQPVTEDCTICHDPHGTTQAKALKARVPFLCQTCHSAQFHPSTLYDGTAAAAFDNHLMAGGCLNCHPRIHGTNHPSGPRFTR